MAAQRCAAPLTGHCGMVACSTTRRRSSSLLTSHTTVGMTTSRTDTPATPAPTAAPQQHRGSHSAHQAAVRVHAKIPWQSLVQSIWPSGHHSATQDIRRWQRDAMASCSRKPGQPHCPPHPQTRAYPAPWPALRGRLLLLLQAGNMRINTALSGPTGCVLSLEWSGVRCLCCNLVGWPAFRGRKDTGRNPAQTELGLVRESIIPASATGSTTAQCFNPPIRNQTSASSPASR